MALPLAIDTVDATFWLAVIVLAAAVGLAVLATFKEGKSSRQLFALIGVMLGLFGAGGLGSLFAKQAATEAADQTQAAAETGNAEEEKEAAKEEAEEEGAAQGNGKGTGGGSGE